MAFELKRKLYESLPLPAKRCICLLPFGLLAGKAYRQTLARAQQFERASPEEIRAYQSVQLGRMLRFAADCVPAYEHLRSTVARLAPFEALKAFPLVDKDSVQANFDRHLPHPDRAGRHYEISTGGTSGNQLKLRVDDVSQSVETAFIHRHWRRVGYTPRSRKACFRGVQFGQLPEGIYWKHNPIYNELQFSPFHMSEDTLDAYVAELARYRPAFLHGYPSAIDVLAEYVLRHGLARRLGGLRAVLLASEGCLEGQAERITAAFGARVYTFYGHSERLILAGECEKSQAYHHCPDYGVLEIISDDDAPCESPGQRGELVGTGLLNRSMPLIRYRTGDYATRLEARCECGRRWERFTNVEGHRKQEMLIGRSGVKVSMTALNMHGPLFERVIRYQYHQDAPGRCELRLMVAPGFGEADRLAIEQAHQSKTGDELCIIPRVVEAIALTRRGKVKRLVSTLGAGPAGPATAPAERT